MSQGYHGPYGAGDGLPGRPRAPEQPPQGAEAGVFRRWASRFGAQRPTTAPQLGPLISITQSHDERADIALLERAYRIAEHYHEGQTRKSGDPYITHPLAVASILAELGMDVPTLCAALLHDTVEDTSYTLVQLRADFGDEIAEMVDGVTKLDKVTYGDSAKAESLRKMVLAMSRDLRVLVIKLADRLHNMRTIGYLRPDKQARIARDTLEIYAPLSHRLGMNALKWELEDRSFAAIEPKIYDELVRQVAAEAPMRDQYLGTILTKVRADLADARLRAEVYGRPKHYYSIYQKMLLGDKEFKAIYDLIGIRILVESQKDCYAALGILHQFWRPLPGRFKDYIAMPKFNLYRSLHTTVLDHEGRPLEFQIRTYEMHREAEYGVAAHWKYKQAKVAGDELLWVRRLNDWQKETADPGEFLDALRFEVNASDVYVFSPKHDVISLPQGSTPVDFAYAVHTEVGHHCIGARVNGRLVPLESRLNNGDVVDVLTSKSPTAGPSRDWLNFVKSTRARNKIKQYFTRERRDEAIEHGKELLAKQMRRSSLPMQRLLTIEHLTEVADHLRLPDVNALYAAIGEGSVGAQFVVERLIGSEGGVEAAVEATLEDRSVIGRRRLPSVGSDVGVEVIGSKGLWVKLAKCCTPVPGDDIIGFVTRGEGVSVHRRDCTNADALMKLPERIAPVAWAPTAGSSFLVAIQVEGLDRPGLLSDVSRVLSDHRLNILSAAMKATKDRVFRVRMTFETPDPRYLKHVLEDVRKVRGIYEVVRVKQ